MTAKIIDCIEGTGDTVRRAPWNPHCLMLLANSRQGEGKTRRSDLYKLAAEIVTGEVTEGYRNADMDRGHAMEDDARRLYASWPTLTLSWLGSFATAIPDARRIA